MRLREINFPYNTDVVTKKNFDWHLKLYKGYVDKSVEIYDALSKEAERGKANKTYSLYRGLKKGETFAMDGVILHELYFKNMGKDKKTPGTRFSYFAEKNFGQFKDWARDFVACAKAARGWVIACYEQRTGTLRNILQDAHDEGIIMSSYPLLVLDMYEHAYYADYGTDAAAYIDKFMESINWDEVEVRAQALPAPKFNV